MATKTINLHAALEGVALHLKALEGNAVEAFTIQVGHAVKAWQALEPVYNDMRSAFYTVAGNAGKVYTAAIFNAKLTARCTAEGETWEMDDKAVQGLVAYRQHSKVSEAGYRTACVDSGSIVNIDGYTDHLIGMDRGWKTETGANTAERADAIASRRAKALTRMQTAAASIKFDTFYGAGDSAKDKLSKARKIRDALTLEITQLEAQVARERKAAEAAKAAAKA